MGIPELVKRLSHDQRELLVAHVAGPRSISYEPDADNRNARRTVTAMIQMGLVRESGNRVMPTLTVLTELGREVVAGVLAEYAEALIAAGYTGLASPLELRPAPITVKTPALERA